MIRFEVLEIAIRPLLWIALALALFITLEGVASLDLDEGQPKIVLYYDGNEKNPCDEHLREALIYLRESIDLANAAVGKLGASSLTERMIDDRANIGVFCNGVSWEIAVLARSDLEHHRLVRVAQLVGLTLGNRKPWFIGVYGELFKPIKTDPGPAEWPREVTIANLSADPGPHARLFIPKIIAMLTHFTALGFACRSMVRDLSSNTLLFTVAASGGLWRTVITAKAASAIMMAAAVIGLLLMFSVLRHGFAVRIPSGITIAVQLLSVTFAAFLGLALSLIMRTEAKIMLVALVYFVFAFLFSGLISNISEDNFPIFFLSRSLPLGYAMESASDWFFFGRSLNSERESLSLMFALNVLVLLALVVSVQRYRSQL